MRIGARSAVLPSALALLVAMTLSASACGSDGSSAPAGDEGGVGPGPGNEGGTTDPDGNPTTRPDGARTDAAVDTSPTCTGKTGAIGDKTVTLTVDGKQRTFDLHVPANYDATKRTPLVFLFHGYTMTAAQIASATHFAATADARGMIVAFPTGIGASFNAGDCCGQAVTDKVDDVCVHARHDHVHRRRVLRRREAHVLRGLLQRRLPLVFPRVRAVRHDRRRRARLRRPPHRRERLQAEARRPAAPRARHERRSSSRTTAVASETRSRSANSIDAFKTLNGCAAGAGTVVYTKDDVSCTNWGGCTAGADVELCTVTGGGHQWPGGDQLPYGPTLSANLDTSKTIADFFVAHPMP